jgi:hypothetical protein
MTKLLKPVVLFFIVLIAAYFFLVDGIIKAQLERHGTAALQAPLTIGGVSFHLMPTSLSLRDVCIGNARLPTHNLVQAEALSLPLSLRDLFAHKFIIDTIDVHGLRFNRPRAQQNASTATNTVSATNSPQLREALQRVQHMLNHPLASNTIDPNTSITGALLADQFKPLLLQITSVLNALTHSSSDVGDWQILVRRVNIDGAFEFGANAMNENNRDALPFSGTIDNLTPQPKLFDAVTQFDFRNVDLNHAELNSAQLQNVEGKPATLRATGSIDKRKLTQATLRFDLSNFPLTQWSLSTDPALKITVISARADIQAFVSLTGNQFDFNALSHFQAARFDIVNDHPIDSGSIDNGLINKGNAAITQVVADVLRRTDAFDIRLQANGDLSNPVLTMNSSLDVPLNTALQQLQATTQFPPAAQLQPAAPLSTP